MSYSKTAAKASRRLLISLPNGVMHHILTFFFNGDGGFQVVPTSSPGDSWNLFQIGDCPSTFSPNPTYLPTHYQQLPDGELPKFHYHQSGVVGIRGTTTGSLSLRQHFCFASKRIGDSAIFIYYYRHITPPGANVWRPGRESSFME